MRHRNHNTATNETRERSALGWCASLLAIALVLSMGFGARGQSQAPIGYRVIAHPSVSGQSYERRFIMEAFLKKVSSWPDGKRIHPVDLTRSSAVRATFSSDVLGRSVTAVGNYWRQIIFSGRGVPPAEVGSDAEVVRFVLQRPGALGYVSHNADLQGAKTLLIK